ncbi:MAG: substrate binding domain-containing protein, partial [Pseudomonadota bacterium]
RVGDLPDSSLRARKLTDTTVRMVASTAYLEEHGTPGSINDLAEHNLLHYSNLSSGNFWKLNNPNGEERQIRAVGQLTVNNGSALRQAAIDGLGIASLPDFIIDGAIDGGQLVEVLPQSRRDPLGVFAVYPQGRFPQPKVRAFIDHLIEQLKPE